MTLLFETLYKLVGYKKWLDEVESRCKTMEKEGTRQRRMQDRYAGWSSSRPVAPPISSSIT